MREIVLDTETTGLDPGTGDKIVEIGAVELWNHLPTGKTFHKYLNPERNMPEEAQAVHGLTEDFLRDKPLFSQIVDDFLRFIKDSKLIIHNASFDMKFINAELELAKKSKLSGDIAIDTLSIARKKFPGSPASLDSLCRRFKIDNTARVMHGALLDSQILAEVYLELIGGRQPDLVLKQQAKITDLNRSECQEGLQKKREIQLSALITKEEELAHNRFIDTLGDDSIWKKQYS